MVVGGRTLGRLAGALALSLATFAAAQEAAPGATPGSIAQRLIEQAGAQGVFEAIDNDGVSVRHLRSGLVCHFASDGRGGRIVLLRDLARGDNVACDSTDGTETVTLYATRFPRPVTTREQIDTIGVAINQRFPGAAPYELALASDPTLPPYRRLAMIVSAQDGARMFTQANVADISGWSIKLRYMRVAPDDEAARRAEQTAAAIWRAALAEVMANPIP